MPIEAKVKETQSWLEKASQDLQSARWLLNSPDALYNAVGFHCQQAAEKTLPVIPGEYCYSWLYFSFSRHPGPGIRPA